MISLEWVMLSAFGLTVGCLALNACEDRRECHMTTTAKVVKVGACDFNGMCGALLSDGRFKRVYGAMEDMPYDEFVCAPKNKGSR